MDLAFGLANIVVSRSGASSISELALLGKPAILVPSPNVSEDHQTKNARALENQGAAILIKDSDTRLLLAESQLALSNGEKLESLGLHIRSFARPNAAADIAREVILLSQNK